MSANLSGGDVVDAADIDPIFARMDSRIMYNRIRFAARPCPQNRDCPADLNGDGVVDAVDLAMLLGNWG